MGVKARVNKRVGLSVSSQAMMNQVIAPGNEARFTCDDYIVIDFLSRTSSPTEDFLKKVANRVCCWDVEFQIATTPSKFVDQAYLDYIKNSSNLNKRMMTMLIERLKSQVQILTID